MKTALKTASVIATAALLHTTGRADWRGEIRLLQQHQQQRHGSLIFGMMKGATDDYDAGIDALKPPPSLVGDAALVVNAATLNLAVDMRAPGTSGIWRMWLAPSVLDNWIVTWATDVFPRGATLTITQTDTTYTNVVGTAIDMLTKTSLVATAGVMSCYVLQYTGPPTPQVWITDIPTTVRCSTISYVLHGTNSDGVVGSMSVSNEANGVMLVFPAEPTWISPAVPLSVGNNRIWVSVTNVVGEQATSSVDIVRNNAVIVWEAYLSLGELNGQHYADMPFGAAEDASDDYDSWIDLESGPPSPVGAAGYVVTNLPSALLHRDMRSYALSSEWHVVVIPAGTRSWGIFLRPGTLFEQASVSIQLTDTSFTNALAPAVNLRNDNVGGLSPGSSYYFRLNVQIPEPSMVLSLVGLLVRPRRGLTTVYR